MKEKMKEMLDKFNEDFEESLFLAMRFYEYGNSGRNYRYVCQAKDFAYIAYHFGVIDYDCYYGCLRKVDKYDLTR